LNARKRPAFQVAQERSFGSWPMFQQTARQLLTQTTMAEDQRGREGQTVMPTVVKQQRIAGLQPMLTDNGGEAYRAIGRLSVAGGGGA
jgi:hypothetical protein